ncbi:helix-turn-helix domain-containing protein [Pseudonocardia benzenivorans]|uniref:helix-turn-helix domain-containing protein n=1 Tax=Pseudonocardia benzenivorans TaxID=228005 RepID=UPI003D153B12
MSTNAAAETGPLIPEWSLGDRFRKVRRITGLSQAEFAQRLGTNQKTYAAWELDTTAPRNPVAVAKRIEAFAGVPAGWMLGLNSPS